MMVETCRTPTSAVEAEITGEACRNEPWERCPPPARGRRTRQRRRSPLRPLFPPSSSLIPHTYPTQRSQPWAIHPLSAPKGSLHAAALVFPAECRLWQVIAVSPRAPCRTEPVVSQPPPPPPSSSPVAPSPAAAAEAPLAAAAATAEPASLAEAAAASTQGAAMLLPSEKRD
jgi:hypothetical protein